jgi:hypothetical protein
MTPINKIVQLDLLDDDFYSVSYYAYDTLKKKNCILTLTKQTTSWEYSIEYK